MLSITLSQMSFTNVLTKSYISLTHIPPTTGPSTAQRLPIWLRDKEYLIELVWSNNNHFVFLDAIEILMKFFLSVIA